jgi:signal transduction histidine kinase/ligand-binding sensor domain-containing protein
VSLYAAIPHAAGERVVRFFDQRDGLPASEVVRLAQDRRGFIWIGTFAGLVRYDGRQMRTWAPERLSGHVSVLEAGPQGDVIVRIDPGRVDDPDASTLYRIVPAGIEPVTGPDGQPMTDVAAAAFGSDGQLCVSRESDVRCRLASGRWVTHPFQDSDETVRFVKAGLNGSVLAVTNRGVWRLAGSGERQPAATLPGVTVLATSGGATHAATFSDGFADVYHLDNDGPRHVLRVEARPIALAFRHDVLWASFDQGLAVVHPDGTTDRLGPDDGFPSGGPLLLDREGSLWLGSFGGLMHMAEPATVIYTARDGLPSGHTRNVARAGDALWVGTWQGLGRMRRVGASWRADRWNGLGRDRVCLDGRQRLWSQSLEAGIVRREPGGDIVFGPADRSNWMGCFPRADGTVWLSTIEGLLLTPPGDGPPRRLSTNPPGTDHDASFRQVLEDRSGRVWMAADGRICQTAAADLLRATAKAAWACDTLRGTRGIAALVELSDGHLWLATDRAGVWSFDGAAWKPLAASASLPSYSLRGLFLSRDGGVWILGHGAVVRVRETHDDQGWQIVERLGGVHGLPSAAAESVLEEADGSLWIATIVGLVHVPASARTVNPEPPPIEIVDVAVNGERLPAPPDQWALAHGDVLELRFAALSFRDRTLLRHQYRLQPTTPWTSAEGAPDWFRFPGLSSGRYTLEVRASLDGTAWSERPARVAFEILPPWYARPGWIATWALLSVGLLTVAYRLRVAVLVELERQRTNIAMDLHDEVGSGLGSIHILSGLAADRVGSDSRLARLVSGISDTAADLSLSLSEIVWSLRSPSASLEMLIAHLTERATRLFPDGSGVTFRLDVPDPVPPVTLSLAVRRNVSLIVVEALHNAARHARAAEVVLSLRPDGRRWIIEVADNGAGSPDVAGDDTGHGRAHMRRRAAEIGAALSAANGRSGGHVVTLRFDPHARGRSR